MLRKMNKTAITLALLALYLSTADAFAFGKKPVTPPSNPDPNVIRARWENSQRDGALWSKYVFDLMPTEGANLLAKTPNDIASFCSNYSNLSVGEKKNFWVYLLSSMAEFESGHKPETSYVESFRDAKGNRVVSRGLLQISIESANAYGCGFRTESELHDPYKNLSCSMRILNRWVNNDGRVAGKAGSAWQGGARYWSVLRSTNAPLAKIQAWTQALDICR